LRIPVSIPGAARAPGLWNADLAYHEYLAVRPYVIGGA